MTTEKTDIGYLEQDPAPGYRGKEGDDKIVKKSGALVKDRKKEDYDKLWKRFKKDHAQEYCEKMGYSLKEIERVGKKKFIDAHDWRSVSDIHRWKTDRINIVICAHCRNEFTTYQMDIGICGKCKKHYDFEKFMRVCQKHERKTPGIIHGIKTAFVFEKDFRDKFLK